MSEALFLEFTGIGEAEYAAVNKHLGIDMQTGQGDWLRLGSAGCHCWPTTSRAPDRAGVSRSD